MWILYIAAAIAVLALIKKAIETKSEEDVLRKSGINPFRFIDSGSYVFGHIPIQITFIYPLKEEFKIYGIKPGSLRKEYLASIETAKIKDITLENKYASDGGELVGALVTIIWREGNFIHNTAFQFVGGDAVNRADILHNRLIKVMNGEYTEAEDLDDQMRYLVQNNNKLQAVKICKERKAMGLLEAKTYVESLSI